MVNRVYDNDLIIISKIIRITSTPLSLQLILTRLHIHCFVVNPI